MLEKIGLPAKPSMRGGNWVVDASHCQGCSTQFTFINRKHHCRRCGGLFCNSCTQQRMVLRGQGDAPVRICDPCKKLEEAARFEMRYGHKNRSAKGGPKQTLKHEDEILDEILGSDGKQKSLSESKSRIKAVSDLLTTGGSSSSSTLVENLSGLNSEGYTISDVATVSPEELRHEAAQEKNKYKVLKEKGKSKEALEAFKHAKELERQADALELKLRKERRIASKAASSSTSTDSQKLDNLEEPNNRKSPPMKKSKDDKDALAAELRELGWSDADLRDADKKTANLTLEGELANLIGDRRKSSRDGETVGGKRTQVIALKRKALALKREGKLVDAKEELKKAKVLEKQIEEEELLGDYGEESDDEISALIRSMDGDSLDDLLPNNDQNFNFNQLMHVPGDFEMDGNLDVTDADMNDPELAAALESFGWNGDDLEDNNVSQAPAFDREALMDEVHSLKKDAVLQKRAGNVTEAMSILKKAKEIEKSLENLQSNSDTLMTESMESTDLPNLPIIKNDETPHAKGSRKSKLVIQKELLDIKKRALALRREGRLEEADAELKKGEVLEQQLEEMENMPKGPVSYKIRSVEPQTNLFNENATFTIDEDKADAEVTDQDMSDPALLSVLKNLGWQDEDSEHINKESNDGSPPMKIRKAHRSKAEIQRELLAVKRKALTLRRQGKIEEYEEELKKAKVLEDEMAEDEQTPKASSVEVESHDVGPSFPQDMPALVTIGNVVISDSGLPSSTVTNLTISPLSEEATKAQRYNTILDKEMDANQALASSPSDRSMHTRIESHLAGKQDLGAKSVSIGSVSSESVTSSFAMTSSRMANSRDVNGTVTTEAISNQSSLSKVSDVSEDEILSLKRKAVALKREGKLAEAREELRKAKLLEKNLEDGQQMNEGSVTKAAFTSVRTPKTQEIKASQAQKSLSSRERLRLQQESLAHKRNALKLRREGKMEESEAELELAKALESQLDETNTEGSSTSKVDANDNVIVEDLLDPQLMAALKSLGWGDADLVAQPSRKSEAKPLVNKSLNSSAEAKPPVSKSSNSSPEKAQLEEQIKNEKLRALNLKRAGKQAEALEALRASKRLEKKLEGPS